MKKAFILEPILVVPDLNREMQMEADISDYTTEGVLLVKCKDGKWRPVVFISKLMNLAKRNYKIHNKEILAVIRYLEAQRHYLEETRVQFEIWIDHKNLQYFMTSQKLNYRQVKQTLYLFRFNFVLEHIPGKSMEKADGLSKRSNQQKEVENNNEDRKLIKPEWIQKEVRQEKKMLIEKKNHRGILVQTLLPSYHQSRNIIKYQQYVTNLQKWPISSLLQRKHQQKDQ